MTSTAVLPLVDPTNSVVVVLISTRLDSFDYVITRSDIYSGDNKLYYPRWL